MILLIEFIRGYSRAADARDAIEEAIRDGKHIASFFDNAHTMLEILDGHRKAPSAFGLGARAAVSADELESLRRALARAESAIPIKGPGGYTIDAYSPVGDA